MITMKKKMKEENRLPFKWKKAENEKEPLIFQIK